MNESSIEVSGYIMILTYAAFAIACGYANWRRSKSMMGSISIILLSFSSIMVLKYDIEIRNIISNVNILSETSNHEPKIEKEESLLFTKNK